MTKKDSLQYTSPEQYIHNQPLERQRALNLLRQTIRERLPEGFKETMQYNMISYVIPHDLYPKGYHCNSKDAIPFISFANQKNYIALYHMGIVADEALRHSFVEQYTQLGLGKLDMGQGCIRFKNIDAIPVELIGEVCTKLTPADFISIYEKHMQRK